MGLLLVISMLLAGAGAALAGPAVPLPPPRPALQAPSPTAAAPPPAPDPFAGIDRAAMSSKPTPCDQRLANMADIELMPRLVGPGACGGHDMVRLTAVVLPDKSRVAVKPVALLNCPMAESLSAWLRDAVAPALAKHGDRLTGLVNYDSYQCRTRDNLPNAKISEHAHGDAIDVRAFVLGDGRHMSLVDKQVDKPLRVALRDSACSRFTTVLGPGEAYHSGHIHLDAIARHNGYRICHWDVLTPEPAPLPPPRPAVVANAAPDKAEPAASAAARDAEPAERQTAADNGTKDKGTRDKDAKDQRTERKAADKTETAANQPAPAPARPAPAPAKPANTVVAMVPARTPDQGESDAAPEILHIKPRPDSAAPQPDSATPQPAAAAADRDDSVEVPMPAPRPARLTAYDARHAHRVRHRKHRKRRFPFHFPFILWR